ncbi:glucokinase [Qipengyuania sp. MTN3-11]|uniref:glucokinase n=1 Tax=Qipengyuania sp. MTN3-11 TaxID=3056557 RepID=UPI0036F3C02F
MSATRQIVVADIGGTHARFAIATIEGDGSIALSEPETLRTEDYGSFGTAWARFCDMQGGALPDAAALAIAGRADEEVIRFTNNPWTIRADGIASELSVSQWSIVNDFEAVAHAVAHTPDEELVHLAGPANALAEDGTISILGPGTGLGVAHLRRFETGYEVQSTEGGHIGFAPLDAVDDAILARLRRRYDRVSVERVVSGPGIVEIHRALAAGAGRDEEGPDHVEIWRRGIAGEDRLATAAVERFCLTLGSVAGDIALAQGGFGGVVIAGGLGYRLREILPRSGFAERFTAKGRFSGLMATIPVKLIVHPQPGLLGVAAAFAGQHLGARGRPPSSR